MLTDTWSNELRACVCVCVFVCVCDTYTNNNNTRQRLGWPDICCQWWTVSEFDRAEIEQEAFFQVGEE